MATGSPGDLADDVVERGDRRMYDRRAGRWRRVARTAREAAPVE